MYVCVYGVSVFLCTCIYMSMYESLSMALYMALSKNIHTHTYKCVCVRVYVSVNVYVCVHVNVNVFCRSMCVGMCVKDVKITFPGGIDRIFDVRLSFSWCFRSAQEREEE